MRRFKSSHPDQEITFQSLLNQIEEHFGNFVSNYNIKLSYIDDEGDKINVYETQELHEAIRQARTRNNILKLDLHLLDEKIKKNEEIHSSEIVENVNVVNEEELNQNESLTSILSENVNNSNIQEEEKEQIVENENLKMEEFVIIDQDKNTVELPKENIFEKTNSLFSSFSQRIAQDVKDSSQIVSQNVNEQISLETLKNEINDSFTNLASYISKAHQNANNFVDNILKEEHKDSDHCKVFDSIKMISERTTSFVKKFSDRKSVV